MRRTARRILFFNYTKNARAVEGANIIMDNYDDIKHLTRNISLSTKENTV